MNAHHFPADSWSIEYEFEDLEICEDGVFFGSFNGTAELALNDPRDGDFYVKSIAIQGVKRERQTIGGYGLTIPKRIEDVMLLRRPAPDNQSFAAHLFRRLESTLYASEHAREQFASELEAA
ncbi:hypothetical protein FJV76_14415 [Mesorhizobium sp. WSM4303]|uniref:hypothetical protein n=1 Tax=Mesorhizobium sp. WSM4303 TaxID=2589887 RepID=UPI00115CDA26|nr:hypothetical protein [Mesorhizobium sp. WSM4303]TRD03825.1 hypothetical protein FJV76_14415 [Mesorhizobium sp. WSM4303]